MYNICLSYPITKMIPTYGKPVTTLVTKNIKSIDAGDSCEVASFCMQNHWGTHVDCPRHFFKQGLTVTDYPLDTWFFDHPKVIEISLDPNTLVTVQHIEGKISTENDILLLKSQWSNLRNEPIYAEQNPGIHPDVALYLREKFVNIRAVGIDWISISPYTQREVGRKVHQAFLNPEANGKPILLFEDMDLHGVNAQLQKVYAFPLFLDGFDSAPATVIGVMK